MRALFGISQELAHGGEADHERCKEILDSGGGFYGRAMVQPASLRRPPTEWRDGRDKGRGVRGGILLQGQMGTCGGIPYAVQETSFPGAEERDGTGSNLARKHGCAAAAQHRRRAMGLPSDHRVYE